MGISALTGPIVSLKVKFAIILGVLALTVAVNVGIAGWAVMLLDRELARPLSEIQRIMSALGRAKRAIGEQHNLITAGADARQAAIGPPGGQHESEQDVQARFQHLAAIARSQLRQLDQIEPYRVWAGGTTRRNLANRVDDAFEAAERWFQSRDPAELALASAGLFDLHELIERIESQILQAAGEGVEFTGVLRRQLTFVLTASFLIVVLAAAYSVNLVHRWVLAPVARLREAAERIGGGDFEHRIDVRGRDEIATLSAEVNHMASMIDRMQRERIERERLAAVGEMVRRIVHNLRNPLAGIRTIAELTREEAPEGSDIRDHQDRIVRTIDRFETWLTSLLNVTKPLTPTLSDHDACLWLREAVDAHRPAAEAAKVQVRLHMPDDPLPAAFDVTHLEQALAALLTNAIEATPPAGTVDVAIEAEPGSNNWRLWIQDDGPGIAANDRNRLFTPYFTTKATGSGIGLAMVKQVVEAHGGQIRLEEPGNGDSVRRGACFVITLPRKPNIKEASSGHAGDTIGQSAGH